MTITSVWWWNTYRKGHSSANLLRIRGWVNWPPRALWRTLLVQWNICTKWIHRLCIATSNRKISSWMRMTMPSWPILAGPTTPIYSEWHIVALNRTFLPKWCSSQVMTRDWIIGRWGFSATNCWVAALLLIAIWKIKSKGRKNCMTIFWIYDTHLNHTFRSTQNSSFLVCLRSTRANEWTSRTWNLTNFCLTVC